MNKFALIGLAAVSALMIGCSSTQCRDGGACADGAVCAGSCEGQDGECCGKCKGEMACNHANSTFECHNAECSADKPCCENCAKKYAESCADCKAHAHACPDCKDGQKCAKCAA